LKKLKKRREEKALSKSKSEQEREWTVRKQDQNPHGKTKSFKELSKESDNNKKM
jgi:hypothetical protein